MPNVGGVFVPDDLMPTMGGGAPARPGYGEIFKGAAEGAAGAIRYGVPYAYKKLANELQPGDEAFYQKGLYESNDAANKAAPASVSDLTSGKVGITRFVGENLVSSFPYMVSGIIGAGAGTLAAGPAGGVGGFVAGAMPQFIGTNAQRAVQEQGGLSDAGAATSEIMSLPQAASETLVGRYIPGLGHALGAGPVAEVGAGFLRRTAASITKAGLTEAVTEAGQQAGERASAGIPLATPDAAAEYVNAAVTAFAIGGTLGAAGGFRRTNAMAKPIEQVTPDDMIETIDSFISGSGRVQGPVERGQSTEHQLGLNLPGGQATEQQAGLPLADTEVAPVARPSELPQLPLDPALSNVPPETQLELGQRFRDNVTPAALPLEGGVAVSPEAEAALRGEAPVADGDLSLQPSGRFALANPYGGGNKVFEAPVQPGVDLSSGFRPFASETAQSLEELRKTKGASPEALAHVDQEFAARAAEAVGDAPLTTDNFQTRVDELKRGLRGGFVQTLEATNPTELLDKVYDQVFTNADQRSNTVKFAQRLGLLDEDLKPGPKAAEVEARRESASEGTADTLPDAGGAILETPAPPANVTTTAPASSPISVPTEADPADVAAVAKAKSDIGVQREGALTTLNTPAEVFAQLAVDRSEAKRGGSATRVEQLAKKLGLITNDTAMDYTPKGRQVYLQSPQGVEATTSAAADNGFAGAAASQFDRGVRAHLSGQEQTTFGDFEEMAAYTAGKTWAKDFVTNGEVKSAEQTRSIQARQEGRQTGAPTPRKSVERAALTPLQVRQQSLNSLIDAADLRTVNDTDIVALRRMAREGVEPAVLGQALQKAQGGETLFQQPKVPTEAPKAFSPMPTRGGQPAFHEMRGDAGAIEAAGIRRSKAGSRVETEAAVRAYGLRNLIQFALEEKAITQQRADRLHSMLDDGKVDAVAKNLKSFDVSSSAFERRADQRGDRREEAREPSSLGHADPAFEQAVDGRTFHETLDHMIENAPSAYHRAIMRGVKGLVAKAEQSGVKFNFQIAHLGDEVPAEMARSGQSGERASEGALNAGQRAVSLMTRVPPEVSIWVKGADLGDEAGANYQIVAHEMVHAATQMILDAYEKGTLSPTSQLGQAVGHLNDLVASVVDHFNARFDAGNLSAFEQRYLDYKNNALVDAHEVLAWGLTNPDMQRYLSTIEYAPKQTVWSKLVDLLRRVVGFGADGIEVKHTSALAELLRVSERIMDAKQADLTSVVVRNRFAGMGTARLVSAASEAGVSAANRTVEATGDVLKNFAAMSSRVVEAISPDIDQKLRRTSLRWKSHNQLNRTYGARMPGLLKHTEAHRWRDAVRANFEAMGDDVYQAFEKIERDNRKASEWVGQLMATATEFQVDPEKVWEEHTHIAEKDRARVKPMYDAAVKLKNDLSRGDGAGYKVFQQFRAYNEAQNYARLAASLHNLVALDPELALGVQNSLVNPTEAFLAQQGLTTGPAIRDWWQKTLHQQIAATVDFVNTKKGENLAGTASEQLAMRQHLSPIEMQISAIHEALGGMQKAPYFHLGRFGDYFGAALVRTNADGTVNPEAMEKVAAALEAAGFDDVNVTPGNTRAKVMMRFETADQTNKFKALMQELHAQGLLEGELKDALKTGARSRENNFGNTDGFPAFVRNYIESIEASPVYTPEPGMTDAEVAGLAKQKEEAVRLAVDTWLEAQPDNSISKVLAKRYTVPGYKKDMIRNFAHRWRVGSISLANVASAPKFNDAFVDMRSAVEEAKSGDSTADQYLLNDLLAETKARDATNPVNENADSFDKARAIAHSYFLGLSPAYAFINMTQMGVVALPELAKKHGYAKSFHAMRRASADAGKIMKAAFNEAMALGPQNWASVAITESVLTKAGLDPKVAAFALRMIASGTIDIGSQARSLGQVSQNRIGSKLDTGLKYASALGMYSETFSRLVTALAAHDMHEGNLDSAAKYATDVVSESMLDYQSWNTARALGKKGILGPVTPIVTQFMSYSVQMTEKLLSEFIAAAGRGRPGESVESLALRKKEARTFLMGHLTAIVALTGTLGLPFMTVFATALERMVDKMDDDEDPFDITATFRGWVSDVLGKDVGEVVSRGLPRALGFDISTRAGEQNLLPFSEFFADRRPWKDAVESNVGRSMGAVPSMVSNIVTGGGKIADGDVVGGMKDMMPVAFKGPVEAYRMANEGYVDSQGNKLPMSPKASAMVWQLLGVTPSQKAEYSEARGDIQSRKGEVARRAGVLRDQIVGALLDRDMATANQLLAEAHKFDTDNPSVNLVNSVPAALQRKVMNGARASALKTPIGVSMDDIAGQEMARYANVGYGN